MMGNVAEPDTRHFASFDVYTHVTYADLSTSNPMNGAEKDEYDAPKTGTLSRGDSIYASNAVIIFDSLTTKVDKTLYHLEENDIVVQAHLTVMDLKTSYQAKPLYIIHDNMVRPYEEKVDALGLKLMFVKLNPQNGKVDIAVQEKKSNKRDFIVMQALVFPYINILWLGAIIMAIGSLLSIVERLRKG